MFQLFRIITLSLILATYALPLCAEPITTVKVPAGDEQALREAVKNAKPGEQTIVYIDGHESFDFSVINDTLGCLLYLIVPEGADITIKGDPTHPRFAMSGLGGNVFQPKPGAPPASLFYVPTDASLRVERLTMGGFQVSDCTPGGVALVDSGGQLEVFDAELIGNSARQGGAIAAGPGAQVWFDNCLAVFNSSDQEGGVIFGVEAEIAVTKCVLAANGASTGAAVYNEDGSTRIRASVIHGNDTITGGSAIRSDGGSLECNNVSVTHNGIGVSGNGTFHTDNSIYIDDAEPNIIFGGTIEGSNNYLNDLSATIVGENNENDPLLTDIELPELQNPDDILPDDFIEDFLDRYRTGTLTKLDELDIGQGSEAEPGSGPGSPYPVDASGIPVSPERSTAGALQPEPPVNDPGPLSGVWYDPKTNGLGQVFLRNRNDEINVLDLFYDFKGNQTWEWYQLNPHGVAENPQQNIYTDPQFPATSDLPTERVFNFSGAPPRRLTGMDLYGPGPSSGDSSTLSNLELELIPLNGQIGNKAIQDGHSGLFVSAERFVDRFVLFILPRGEALLYWATVNAAGLPAWFLSIGQFDGDSIVFADIYTTSGPSFSISNPDAYDPADLVVTRVGSLTIAFSDCDNAALTYDVQGLGPAGEISLERELSIRGTTCTDN